MPHALLMKEEYCNFSHLANADSVSAFGQTDLAPRTDTRKSAGLCGIMYQGRNLSLSYDSIAWGMRSYFARD